MGIALVVLLALVALAVLVLTGQKPAPRACLGIAVASPTELTALMALVTQLTMDLSRQTLLCDATKRPLLEAWIGSMACRAATSFNVISLVPGLDPAVAAVRTLCEKKNDAEVAQFAKDLVDALCGAEPLWAGDAFVGDGSCVGLRWSSPNPTVRAILEGTSEVASDLVAFGCESIDVQALERDMRLGGAVHELLAAGLPAEPAGCRELLARVTRASMEKARVQAAGDPFLAPFLPALERATKRITDAVIDHVCAGRGLVTPAELAELVSAAAVGLVVSACALVKQRDVAWVRNLLSLGQTTVTDESPAATQSAPASVATWPPWAADPLSSEAPLALATQWAEATTTTSVATGWPEPAATYA